MGRYVDSSKVKTNKMLDLIRATTVDLFAKIAFAALYPIPQTLFDPKEGEVVKDQVPILLVHGYLHNSSAWAYFRYRLKKAGFENIFTINLGYPFHSIEDYAEKVAVKVKEIQKITGSTYIKLVGHSMGGLVCSYYATHLAPKDSVSCIITLGSPLNGTKVRGLGKCAEQMRYRSKFVRDLRKRILNSQIKYYHIGSDSDLIIRPSSSTVIEENKHIKFKNLGHASYPFSDRVIRCCIEYWGQA